MPVSVQLSNNVLVPTLSRDTRLGGLDWASAQNSASNDSAALEPQEKTVVVLAPNFGQLLIRFSLLVASFLEKPETRNQILLVELTGIEPVTPCLQSRCSPS